MSQDKRMEALENINIGIGVLGRMAIGQWRQDQDIGIGCITKTFEAIHFLLPELERAHLAIHGEREFTVREKTGLGFFEGELSKKPNPKPLPNMRSKFKVIR